MMDGWKKAFSARDLASLDEPLWHTKPQYLVRFTNTKVEQSILSIGQASHTG